MSGRNVRVEQALDDGDPVFEQQLALFKAAQQEFVAGGGAMEIWAMMASRSRCSVARVASREERLVTSALGSLLSFMPGRD